MNEYDYLVMRGRLINWARAVGGGFGGPGHCRSVEFRYKPDDWDTRRQARPVPPDYADADLIETAWRTVLEPQAKWFLKWHYISRLDNRATAARFRRKFGHSIGRDWEYERMHQRSVRAIWLVLDGKRAGTLAHDRVIYRETAEVMV